MESLDELKKHSTNYVSISVRASITGKVTGVVIYFRDF